MENVPNTYEVGADSSQHDMGNDFTLVERPNIPCSVEEPPPLYMSLNNASDPPVYAVVRKNRAGTGVVQSEDSAPAGNTAAGDESTNPAITIAADDGGASPLRSSLYDITLIDNDLYSQDI